MKGCGLCWTPAELELLDGDPALVPDTVVWQFAWEVEDHFEPDEYELAWRRLAPRVLDLLESDPDSRLTQGLTWANLPAWPEDERTALRARLAEIIIRSADSPELSELVQAAAQMDEDLTPWLRVVDGLPDSAVAELAHKWSYAFLSGGTPCDGGWLRWDEPAQPIRGWLLTPALRDRLSGMDNEVAQYAVMQVDALA